MISSYFISHASHVFFGALGAASAFGVLRAAARGLSRSRRATRLVGTPLLFFVLLMTTAHAASYAPATTSPAMAFAMVSPVSRLVAARKLTTLIRTHEKSPRSVESLVAADLVADDCARAESDAYRFRARSSWPGVLRACGPSDLRARALFEDGELEASAVAFQAARAARPSTPVTIDELTAYALTHRAAVASAVLRASAKGLPVGDANGLTCLAEAFERVGGLRRDGSEPVASAACVEVHAAMSPERDTPLPAPSETTCVPHAKTEPRSTGGGIVIPDTPDPLDPLPAAAAAGDPLQQARWLSQRDDAIGALAIVDRELARYAWTPPRYTSRDHERHAVLIARAEADRRQNVWVRADCTEEVRVPSGHPLAEEVAAERAAYDPSLAAAELANARGRDAALEEAYRTAIDALDGPRAEAYRARRLGTVSEPWMLESEKLRPDPRAPLLLGFSPEAAWRALRDDDKEVREAAKAGSGTRIAERLRALEGSGRGTIDLLGATIPEGREALRAFVAFDARLDCHRAAPEGSRCTALSLVRALGDRHRMARAVGEPSALRETEDALERLLRHDGGAWLHDASLERLLAVADRVLRSLARQT